MPEDDTGSGTRSDENAGGEGQEPPAGGKDDSKLTPEAQAALREARAEAASWRTKFRASEAKVNEFESANLSETQKLQRERDEAATKAQAAEQRAIKAEVKADAVSIATTLGFKEPGLAHKLVDISELQIDETTGAVSGLKAQLEQIAKEHPTLVGAATPRGGGDGGQGQDANEGQSMSDMIRQQAGR